MANLGRLEALDDVEERILDEKHGRPIWLGREHNPAHRSLLQPQQFDTEAIIVSDGTELRIDGVVGIGEVLLRFLEALQIIHSMPKRHEEIFPYCGDTIGTNFTRACQFLEIIDLHLHDLRHDGISRLFEIGRNIPQVAAVSGHRSWSSLKRYTHLRQTGDKYAGWKWFSVLTSSTSSLRAPPKYAFTEDFTTGWLDLTARG